MLVDYGLQVKENIDSGQSFFEAVYHQNIDEGEMIGAAASGMVMVATFEVGGPVTLADSVLYGCAGGVLGGQAGSLMAATWDEADAALAGEEWDGTRLFEAAREGGLFDPSKMFFDAVAGVVSGGVGWGLEQVLSAAGFRPTGGGKKMPQQIYMYRKGEIYFTYAGMKVSIAGDEFDAFMDAFIAGHFRVAAEIMSELAQTQTSRVLEDAMGEY